MVGQKNLITQITKSFDVFPRFSIITGQRGSGKKTLLLEHIYSMLEVQGYSIYTVQDIKIDSIRDMIADVYKLHKVLFVIADADNMSIGAKNAMLKIVEECPNDNYFIMTLEDENNTLATIKSRAVIYKMENYSKSELQEYMRCNSIDLDDKFIDIAETPGDINLIYDSDADAFYDYVLKVMNNIATVSGANSFKIADKIAFKEDDTDKYDLRLFWKIFIKQCVDSAIEYLENDDKSNGMKYLFGARDTSGALRRLSVKGLNKQMLFDKWILDIREDWR